MSTIPPDIEALDEAMVAALGPATTEHIRAVINSHMDYVLAHPSKGVIGLAATKLTEIAGEMQAGAINLLLCIGAERRSAVEAVTLLAASTCQESLNAIAAEAPLQ